MSAVVQRDPSVVQRLPEAQVIRTDAGSLMDVISKAASDPQTDVNKLERLVGLYERITAQGAKAAYAEALSAMQPELPVIVERGGIRDRNGRVQSTYAKWEDINEAIKPVLARHGFGLSFRTGREDSQIVVTGVLSHRGGHTEQTTIHLPIDTSGSKNAVQAVGSSTSYGQRYTAKALLNLTSRAGEDKDDDGGSSGPPVCITEDQVADLRDLMEEVNADERKFLAHIKLDRLQNILASKYEEAVRILNQKRKRP